MKTLLIYGTRKGTTAETAAVIAEVLSKEFLHEVTLCESIRIREYKKQLDQFDLLIIGSSIVSGRWKGGVLRFTKKKLLQGRKVALFVTAGGTMNLVTKGTISKEEAITQAIERYIDRYEGKFHFKPIGKGVFGGKVIRKEVERYNNWNREDISAWSRELGKIAVS